MPGRLQKFVYAILLVWGVLTAVFLLFQALGDPAGMLAGQAADKKTLENIRRELHLQEPAWKQYLYYLNDISPVSFHRQEELLNKRWHGFYWGNETVIAIKIPYLRASFQSGKPVTDILSEALPGTVLLSVLAMVMATLAGILLGTAAAVFKDSGIDRLATLTGIAGVSLPSFLAALLIALLLGYWLQPFTGLPMTGNWKQTDPLTGETYLAFENWILPAISLGIRPMAIIMQMTRSSMIEVLGQDYIRTAHAKGLKKSRIVFRHALPNAINPVITAISGWFAELMAGAFFVEYIFGWHGLGKVTVEALEKLDYPVLMGSVLLTAFFFMSFSALTDRVYRMIDPRVRLS